MFRPPKESEKLEERNLKEHIAKYEHRVLFETDMLSNSRFARLVECDFNDSNMFFKHLESLPIKLVIFDDFASVITTPNNSDRDKFESLITYNRNLIELYTSAFDGYWEKAKPLRLEDIEKALEK